MIIEKLLEQRDFYLNTLKHLDFEKMIELTPQEFEKIEKTITDTIVQIKKVEQEIAFLSSKNNTNL